MQQHRELELLNSFRERFGCDWLQYRSHLETLGSPPLVTTKTLALSTSLLDAQSLETACSPPATGGAAEIKESPQKVSEESRVEPEPYEEEREERDKEEESREDLEEEEEQEQKEVEGERPVTIGEMGTVVLRCQEGCGEVSLGSVSWDSRGSDPVFTPVLSWTLCSGALSSHVGVSPAGP